jgi:hypothetical protein
MRRLSEGRPTAIQLSKDHFYMFGKDKACVKPTKNPGWSLPRGAFWALCNSNDSVTEPCEIFLRSGAMLVQATSPASSQWKRWKKQHGGTFYCMKYWDSYGLEVAMYVIPYYPL